MEEGEGVTDGWIGGGLLALISGEKLSSILSFTSKPFLAKSKGLRFPGKGTRFKTSNFEKGIVSGFILNFDEASA